MDILLKKSLEEQKPIVIMYMSEERVITDRKIIVTKIQDDYIRAYCLKRHQLRTFKRSNILAAAKPFKKRERKYA